MDEFRQQILSMILKVNNFNTTEIEHQLRECNLNKISSLCLSILFSFFLSLCLFTFLNNRFYKSLKAIKYAMNKMWIKQQALQWFIESRNNSFPDIFNAFCEGARVF